MSKKNEKPKRKVSWNCDKALLEEFQKEALEQGVKEGFLLEQVMKDYLNNLRFNACTRR